MYNYNNPYLNNYYSNQNNSYSNNLTQTPLQYPTTSLIFVNGFNDVKDYIISLNSTIYFKDSNSDKIFIKSCDNTGKVSLKAYKLAEITENDNTTTLKQEDFVKISDFKALQEDFNNLKALITKNSENKGVEQ